MRSIFPILCNYYVTTRCNAKCIFCDIHTRPGENANADDVLINLRHLKKMGVKFIDFTGGEPLLHPQLPLFLKTAKLLKLRTTVTTNTLLYPRTAEAMEGCVDLLHFSLDAPDAATHNRIRGVPCFDSVMESLDIARSLNEKPDLLFTVTDDTRHHLPEMVALAQRHRRILIVNPVFSYFGNAQCSNPLLDDVLRWAKAPYVYVNRAVVKLMRNGGNQVANPRCRAVTTTVVIDTDNTLLLPCYHHASMRLPINGDLKALWTSEPVRDAQAMEGRHSVCQGCAISCYFDPSFTHTVDTYFLLSQASKIKYAMDKYLK